MTCVAAQGQLWYESVIFCIWDSLPATGLYIIIKLTFVKWTSQIASKILLSGFCQIFLVPAKVKNSIQYISLSTLSDTARNRLKGGF